MIIKNPQHIYQGEIWTQTQCLDHEAATASAISLVLKFCGYLPHPDGAMSWSNSQHRVRLCLVDDVRSCVPGGFEKNLANLFDAGTLIITDNVMHCSTDYSVKRVPQEFFGIYGYRPEAREWNPQRDFAYQVNRMDHRRCLLLLLVLHRMGMDRGLINFNGDTRVNPDYTASHSWQIFWNDIPRHQQVELAAVHNMVRGKLPLHNYDIPFDIAPLHVWLNLVVETYASDDAIALSEKIFRCLVTPSPWMIYAGRQTMAYLDSLGFDCVGDVVDHRVYDQINEADDKTTRFVDFACSTIDHLKCLDRDKIKKRYQEAAQHNQNLLLTWRRQWPDVFKAWLDTLASQLLDGTIAR